jgi:hypothetical protein
MYTPTPEPVTFEEINAQNKSGEGKANSVNLILNEPYLKTDQHCIETVTGAYA